MKTLLLSMVLLAMTSLYGVFTGSDIESAIQAAELPFSQRKDIEKNIEDYMGKTYRQIRDDIKAGAMDAPKGDRFKDFLKQLKQMEEVEEHSRQRGARKSSEEESMLEVEA